MDTIPTSWLLAALVLLIGVSAFFSGAETALLTVNRYRLLHLSKSGNVGAARALRLLMRPDRLIGLILLGNNFVNVLASALTTVLGLRLYGDSGIAIAAGCLTLILLVFGEVAPKTIAAIAPERVALPASCILWPLLRVLYPLVAAVGLLSNWVIRMFGYDPRRITPVTLSAEELKTVVAEAGQVLPERYRRMLLSILDLEAASVRDIMIPRQDIVGIDLDDPLEDILRDLKCSHHHRFPVFKKTIDRAFGMLHLQEVLRLLDEGTLSKETLVETLTRLDFVPNSTPLHRLLNNFKEAHAGMALVVDEYGDVAGLVTMEDLLQKIVGEFTMSSADIRSCPDGGYLVDAGISVRELNYACGLNLPTEGPVTLNGLIIEYLETIPEPGINLQLMNCELEVVEMDGKAVKSVRLKVARDGMGDLLSRDAATL